MRRTLPIAMLLALLLTACATPRGSPPPGASFSGIAPLVRGAHESSWLVVMDAKDARSERLLVARWGVATGTSARWESVTVAD